MKSKDVASQLGVTRQTVARWIREGKLRASRLQTGAGRGMYRIQTEDFRDLVRRYVRDDWK